MRQQLKLAIHDMRVAKDYLDLNMYKRVKTEFETVWPIRHGKASDDA